MQTYPSKKWKSHQKNLSVKNFYDFISTEFDCNGLFNDCKKELHVPYIKSIVKDQDKCKLKVTKCSSSAIHTHKKQPNECCKRKL